MLNKIEKRKALLQQCSTETVKYSIVGILISIGVGDNYEPIFGLWTYPLIFISVFLFLFLVVYLPNAKADETLIGWRGEEYVKDLDKQLETKSYRELLSGNWFVKYLAEKEKEDPPSVTRFMK